MKIKLRKSTLIKVALVVALIVFAPYLIPFTIDFIVIADLMGLEALIVFLLVYAKSIMAPLQMRFEQFRQNVAATALLVAQLYMFKPKVYLGHAAVSSVVIVLASSVLLACAVWMPVMFMSAGAMGGFA